MPRSRARRSFSRIKPVAYKQWRGARQSEEKRAEEPPNNPQTTPRNLPRNPQSAACQQKCGAHGPPRKNHMRVRAAIDKPSLVLEWSESLLGQDAMPRFSDAVASGGVLTPGVYGTAVSRGVLTPGVYGTSSPGAFQPQSCEIPRGVPPPKPPPSPQSQHSDPQKRPATPLEDLQPQ